MIKYNIGRTSPIIISPSCPFIYPIKDENKTHAKIQNTRKELRSKITCDLLKRKPSKYRDITKANKICLNGTPLIKKTWPDPPIKSSIRVNIIIYFKIGLLLLN
jgi:hypothetical protein